MKSNEIKKFRKNYKPYAEPCISEGLKLAVLFDEKEAIKEMGALWSGSEKVWWMPAGRLKDSCINHLNDGVGSGTVRELLDNNKMIIGQHGDFDVDRCNEYALCCHDSTEYVLERKLPHSRIVINRFDEMGAVCFHDVMGNVFNQHLGNHSWKGAWETFERGREVWSDLISLGFLPIPTSDLVTLP